MTAAEGSFFARLRARVNRGASWVADLLPGRRIDAELLDELETRLLEADVGVEATQEILSDLHRRVARAELADAKALEDALAANLLAILKPIERPLAVDRTYKPFVILVVGVNGSGKTTTIGKLARLLKDQGLSVLLAAGDTFRAAAVEQLAVWAERNGVPIVSQATGADPAAVVFDALQSAKARGTDVLIADTAGRLHTQSHLMDELAKIARVIKRLDPDAPHEVLLVLDASLGQNAVRQAEQFNQVHRRHEARRHRQGGHRRRDRAALRPADPLRRRWRTGGGFRYLRRPCLCRGAAATRGSRHAVIRFDRVFKRYPNGREALSELSFDLEAGEMAFLTGHSGAGKSTVLRHIALLERPTRGQVIVNGKNTGALRRGAIPAFRRQVGFVFQDHRLLDDRPVYDNVALPLAIAGVPRREMDKRVRAALDQVGLLGRERSFPLELSAGEQQRVGIARAVITKPPVLIADEPTGNLDPDLALEVMNLFQRFNAVGVTVLVATHDIHLLELFRVRRIHIEKGQLAAVPHVAA